MSELYGVYEGTVVDVLDPEGLGRVRVRLTSRKAAEVERAWARLATLMAGDGRGTWFVPDVGEQVVKSDTVITNSVISSSYTPGVGNIW